MPYPYGVDGAPPGDLEVALGGAVVAVAALLVAVVVVAKLISRKR